MTPSRQFFAGIGVTVVLAAVFMMYTQPDFLVQMANQLWACF
jgi:hypothetical protein